MKSVLKFPIYVEIESDNVDRKIITDAANQILYPHLLSYLANARYRNKVLTEFQEATQVDFLEIKLLTEIDLFKGRLK